MNRSSVNHTSILLVTIVLSSCAIQTEFVENSNEFADREGRITSTQALKAHEKLELVKDTDSGKVTQMLLFGGGKEIVPLHANLMAEMPEVEYFIVASSTNGVSEEDYVSSLDSVGLELNTTNFTLVDTPLTNWTQDRIFRFSSSQDNKSVLLPTVSVSARIGEYAPFELGVPKLLESKYPETFSSIQDDEYYSRMIVDRATSELIASESGYASFYDANVWNLSWGEGGDRLVSENTLLVGRSTYIRMLRSLENHIKLDEGTISYESLMNKIFKKKVVPIGAIETQNRFLFHLDVFLTIVEDENGKDVAILGSPLKTLEHVFDGKSLQELPSGMEKTSFYWQKKIAAFMEIREELLGLGYSVLEIPIMFLDFSEDATSAKAVASFNNGIFSNQAGQEKFFVPSYRFNGAKYDRLNKSMLAAEAMVTDTFQKFGIEVVYVKGGENTVGLMGEIRCTAAVIARQ